MARKGNTSRSAWKGFELKVAKELGEWWCGDPKAFARIACSGAFPRAKADGDVVSAKPSASGFPFAVEAKCRPTVFDREELFGMLVASKDKHPLVKWWHELGQVEVVTSGCKMRWLVVSVRSGKHLLVMGRKEWTWLVDRVGKPALPVFRFDDGRDATQEDGASSLFVCVFRDLLRWCDNPEALGAPKVHESTDKETLNETHSVCRSDGSLGGASPGN